VGGHGATKKEGGRERGRVSFAKEVSECKLEDNQKRHEEGRERGREGGREGTD